MDTDKFQEFKTNKLTQISTNHLTICELIGTNEVTIEMQQSVYGGSIKYFFEATEYQRRKIETYFGDKIKFYFSKDYFSYEL